MIKAHTVSDATLAKVLEDNLGNLPRMLAKLLRAGIETGPRAPMVAAWCRDNPAAAAAIVGAVATAKAMRLNAPFGAGAAS